MAELVGHAACPECGTKSEVVKNKRGKLLLKCPVHSQFHYQTKQGQIDLKARTEFLAGPVSENAPPAVASSQEPGPEPKPEKSQETAPGPVQENQEPAQKKRWSFFK